MGQYKLSTQASLDLDDILNYTWGRYGEDQAFKYVGELKKHLEMLSDIPHLARERTEFEPPVKIFPSGNHFIVYLLEKDYVFVIRFIHSKMDLERHL